MCHPVLPDWCWQGSSVLLILVWCLEEVVHTLLNLMEGCVCTRLCGRFILHIDSCGNKELVLRTNKELSRYSGRDQQPGGNVGPCAEVRAGIWVGSSFWQIAGALWALGQNAAPSVFVWVDNPGAFLKCELRILCEVGEPGFQEGLWGSYGADPSASTQRRTLGFWTNDHSYRMWKEF